MATLNIPKEQADELLRLSNEMSRNGVFKPNSIESHMAEGYRHVLFDALVNRSLTNKLVCRRARIALEVSKGKWTTVYWYMKYKCMGESAAYEELYKAVREERAAAQGA